MDPRTEYEYLKNIAANHYNTITTINKPEDLKSMHDIIKKQKAINSKLVKIVKSLSTPVETQVQTQVETQVETPVEDGQAS